MKRIAAVATLMVAALLAASAASTRAEVTQTGNLRLSVSGRMSPQDLPRTAAAPISVSVGGHISTADGSAPPQLETLRIEINRYGRLVHDGLPICRLEQIQPASSARALAACRAALVGQGRFWANVVLAGQEPSPTGGRLLIFNGRLGSKPVLLGQIYSSRPFDTSFVIRFSVGKTRRGPYGTVLTAPISRVLGSWGHLTGIEMTLHRRYTFRGDRRSFLSATCPALDGFGSALFPLARTKFSFAGGQDVISTLTRRCSVRGGD